MKTYLFLLITFISLSVNHTAAQLILTDSIRTQLSMGVKGFQERYHSPSIVVAIVHGDSIIFSEARGYTDLEKLTPSSLDSKYQIQSITKIFTATMFMQLCEQKVVKIDDDVKEYVPEYPGGSDTQSKASTTLLELATHNSGLPRNSPSDIDFAKQVDKWLLTRTNNSSIRSGSKEAFIASLKSISKQYPDYQFVNPNTRNYSNMGYGLLGLGLERAAKTEYEKYIIENICKPLGLHNTGLGTISSKNNIIVKGYSYLNDEQRFIKTPDYHSNSMIYAGGMYSTAADLAKFISAQFNDDNPTLTGKSRRMMQQLGIGWSRAYPFVMHEGAMLGARSEIIFNPELKLGWVILANTTDFQFNRINEYISGLIVPQLISKSVTDLERYVGTYTLDGGKDSIKIYLKNDSLYSTYLEDLLPDNPLIFSGNNTLKATGQNNHSIHYNFIPGPQSTIKALSLNQLLWIKQ